MNKEMSHERSSAVVQSEALSDFTAMEELPTIPKPPELSALLRKGRDKYGLKQKDVAERIGITPTVVNRIEAGATKKPSERVLAAIAPYTGKGYSELLFIAGYSSSMDREIYYSMDGTEIPYLDIVKDIYKADCGLLEELRGIDGLSYDHIKILKNLIKVMKESENCDKIENDNTVWKRLFDSVVRFLSEQLDAIMGMVRPAMQTQ